MARLAVKGIVFDMYGTVVDVGAVAAACKEVAPDPVAFNSQWRAKQLEYTFLRSLMGRYRDFWKVTEEALDFAIQRFAIQVTSEQRRHLMAQPHREHSCPRDLITQPGRAGQDEREQHGDHFFGTQ